jgi:ribosomal protein S18 acetylase RimI-like enzyme
MANAAPTLEIRRATLDEAAAVADVWLASRKHAFPLIPRSVHADDGVRGWYATVVLVEHEVWVAVLGGRIVAMMVLRGDSMDQLYVLPEHQRCGVGTRLVAQAKRLRRVLRLYAFQSNEPAREFYEKHGFKAIAFGDGSANEEGAPDVLYEWKGIIR